MKKYKVKNTSIMHNGSVAKEGDIIELSDVQAKKLSDFIDFVPESKKSETKSTKNSNKPATETEQQTATSESSATDRGNNGN